MRVIFSVLAVTFGFVSSASAYSDCKAKYPGVDRLEDRLNCLQSNIDEGQAEPTINRLTTRLKVAGIKWQGRCHSEDTGTDLGFVYASTEAGLTDKCAKIAQDPIVDNITTVGCSGADPDCVTDGGAIIGKCTIQNISPADVIAHHAQNVEPRGIQPICALVPPGKTPTASQCTLNEDHWGKPAFCSYSETDENSCAVGWAVSVSMTQTMTSGGILICWTVFNESGDRTRYADIWIK